MSIQNGLHTTSSWSPILLDYYVRWRDKQKEQHHTIKVEIGATAPLGVANVCLHHDFFFIFSRLFRHADSIAAAAAAAFDDSIFSSIFSRRLRFQSSSHRHDRFSIECHQSHWPWCNNSSGIGAKVNRFFLSQKKKKKRRLTRQISYSKERSPPESIASKRALMMIC